MKTKNKLFYNGLIKDITMLDFTTFLLFCKSEFIEKPTNLGFDINNEQELNRAVKDKINSIELIQDLTQEQQESLYKEGILAFKQAQKEINNFGKKIYANTCVNTNNDPFDGKYLRKDFDIIEISEKNLKEQFIDILESFSNKKYFERNGKTFKETFDNALEESILELIMNYRIPNICIKLNKTTYIVGDISKITLKYLKKFYGTLIVNDMTSFKIFTIK